MTPFTFRFYCDKRCVSRKTYYAYHEEDAMKMADSFMKQHSYIDDWELIN